MAHGDFTPLQRRVSDISKIPLPTTGGVVSPLRQATGSFVIGRELIRQEAAEQLETLDLALERRLSATQAAFGGAGVTQEGTPQLVLIQAIEDNIRQREFVIAGVARTIRQAHTEALLQRRAQRSGRKRAKKAAVKQLVGTTAGAIVGGFIGGASGAQIGAQFGAQVAGTF